MLMQTSDVPLAAGVRSAAEIRAWIVGELARSLQADASSIDSAAPLHSHGVDSLAAIGMSAGLAGWLGRDVPATLMWDYDSIDAIAEAMAARHSAAPEAPALPPGIVALRPNGSRCPLFCFPGLAGAPQTFAPLASHLDASQPCFALNIPHADDDGGPLTRIEDIAAVMLSRIRAVRPNGPFQFVGYSLGGLLAYEAAQQVAAAGESVPTLAFYDAFTVAGRTLRPRWQRMLLHAWFLAAKERRMKYVSELIENRRARLKEADREGTAVTDGAAGDAFVEVCMRAALAYKPRSFAGSIVLFRATERLPGNVFFKPDASNGWAALARGGARVFDLPGGHLNLLDTAHAPAAAEALTRELAALADGA